jgi:hypothetical protein
MKNLLPFAIATFVATAVVSPVIVSAEDAPAQQEEAKQIEVTGTLVKEDDKFKLKEGEGKVYLVTKNNDEKVSAFADKKVKIVGKAKSKDMQNGKQLHMIVYVKTIAAAE